MLTPDQVTALAPDASSFEAGRDLRRCQEMADTRNGRARETGTEGGDRAGMLKTASRLVEAGVRVITLLALSDEGAPWYSKQNARQFAALGIPVFACTPDAFPDLMAAALSGKDIHLWAKGQAIATAKV